MTAERMRIELIRRPERSAAMALLSPLIAIGLTVVSGFIIFTIVGVDPFGALYVYFIEKLTAWWSIQDLIVKMTPLILIAVGLSLCYLSNIWNIGAEGPARRRRDRRIGPADLLPGVAGPARADADAAHGHPRRHGLRGDPGAPQDPLRRQRDPDQPDAGLCRRLPARLAGARTVAQSGRPQLSRTAARSATGSCCR